MAKYHENGPGSSDPFEGHDGERWTVSQRGDWDDWHEWCASFANHDCETPPDDEDYDEAVRAEADAADREAADAATCPPPDDDESPCDLFDDGGDYPW